MKKAWTATVTVILAVLLSAGLVMAGNGAGNGSCAGAGDGSGPVHDILAGAPFSYTGTVLDLASGGGLLLSLGEENVTVFGIGPVRYWEAVGVDRPTVGEELTVDGYAVDFGDTVRNIAVAITIGENTVQLRDAETGAPLWRGQGRR